MEMPVSSISVETPKKDPTLGFRGLYEVFVSPSSFFARLKNDPKVLVPYLIGIAFMLIIVLGLKDIIAREQIEAMHRKAADNPNIPQNITAEKMIPWIIGGGVFVWSLVPLIASALALFWGNFVMAGKATYKQLLSIMLFGELVYLVGGLLVLPLDLAKDTMYMSFSLAALVTPDPESLLWLALSKINLFIIWEIIVVGIGLSIFYSFPRNKGYLLSVLSVGLLSILQVLATAIGKMF